MSFSRVCFSINKWMGAIAFFTAIPCEISLCIYGCKASALICLATGIMTIAVTKRASAVVTCLGICEIPDARFKKAKTTVMRAKHVVIIKILGASDRTVRRKNICKLIVTSEGDCAGLIKLKAGMTKSWAYATLSTKQCTASTNAHNVSLFIFILLCPQTIL